RCISKQISKLPEYIEFFFIKQKFFLPCTGAPDIDCRIDAALTHIPVQMEFHVSVPFEFLIDDVIHAASGIHECCGQDRQASTRFDVTRGTEEMFRTVQACGIQSAGECPAARRNHQVICTGKPCDGIHQDNNILSHF